MNDKVSAFYYIMVMITNKDYNLYKWKDNYLNEINNHVLVSSANSVFYINNDMYEIVKKTAYKQLQIILGNLKCSRKPMDKGFIYGKRDFKKLMTMMNDIVILYNKLSSDKKIKEIDNYFN